MSQGIACLPDMVSCTKLICEKASISIITLLLPLTQKHLIVPIQVTHYTSHQFGTLLVSGPESPQTSPKKNMTGILPKQIFITYFSIVTATHQLI